MPEPTTDPRAPTPLQAQQAALIAMAESMEKYAVPCACIDPQSGQIAFMNQGFREKLQELGDSNGQRLLRDDAATAQALQQLVAKGAMPPLVLAVDDCQARYTQWLAQGVEFTQEPIDRYGTVDAGFRDPSGNGWKMIQPRGAA